MYKYKMIFQWSTEDDAYIVDVPELPGCKADGKAASEALANVEMAIAEWLETDRLRSMQMERENLQENLVQYTLDKNSKPTEDQEKRLKKLKDSEICKDSPKLSREGLEGLKIIEKKR